jgi:hypothetical protein
VQARTSADLLPRLDDQVVRPVQACLQQFPEVRAYIKQRNVAHAELQKRTKRLGGAVAAGIGGFGLGGGGIGGGGVGGGGGAGGIGSSTGGAGVGGAAAGAVSAFAGAFAPPGTSASSSVTSSSVSAGGGAGGLGGGGGGGGGGMPTRMRDRDRQRKVREVSDRYKMFDDQVMQRFSYIDRTQPALVLPPLRRLAALLHDFARTSAAEMCPVAGMAAADAPPLTRNIPSPPWCEKPNHSATGGAEGGGTTAGPSGLRDRRNDQHQHQSKNSHLGLEEEGWDDAFDFDDAGDCRLVPGSASLASGTTARRGAVGSSILPSVPLPDEASRALTDPSTAHPASPDMDGDENGNSDPRRVKSAGISSEGIVAIPTAKTSRINPVSAPPVLGQTEDKNDNWEQESRSERQTVLMRLCAMHDYEPLETNELQLHVGDVIEVYEKHHSGWWLGRANHVSGYFPRVYARELTEQEEVDYLNERSRRRKERRRGHRRRDSHDSRRSILSASQTSIPAVSSTLTSPERTSRA